MKVKGKHIALILEQSTTRKGETMNSKQMDRVIKARAGLVLDHPFFGSLVLRLKTREMPEIQTMGTDGKELVFNPAFVDSLTPDELKGVICHEILHVSSAHHCRRQGRDAQRWNISCDHPVNAIVKDAGFTLPKEHLDDPQYRGLTADAIYSRLPADPPGGGKGNGKGNDPGRCGEVLDYPGQDGQQPTQADMDQQAQDWQIATTQAAQAAKAAGKLPGSLARLVEEMNEPKVPWRETLHRFVNTAARNDYSWRRPSSRYMAGGVIMPGLYSEELPPIVVAIDTSESISREDLKQFAGELDEILAQYDTSLHVVYCDTAVAGTRDLDRDSRPVKLEAKGGGGTAFSPVFRHVEKEQLDPSCLVYLTDLECSDFGDAPNYPVLWIKTAGRKTSVPFGEIVTMDH